MRLKQTDLDILHHIKEQGQSSPKIISEEIGKSGEYTRDRVTSLHDDFDLLDRPARGIYTLSNRGERALLYEALNGSDVYDDAVDEGSLELAGKTIEV